MLLFAWFCDQEWLITELIDSLTTRLIKHFGRIFKLKTLFYFGS